MAEAPRIAIFGAGSVGCWIGGAWQAAGLAVSFIGRESVGRDIAEHGLTLTDGDGPAMRLEPGSVCFSTKAAALREADIICLAVKSFDTAAAAKEIGRHARKRAVLISFQNGVSNAATLRSMLPKLPVLRGMVPFNIAYLGRGRWHKGVAGELWAEDAPPTRELAERIGDRAGRLRLEADMDSVAWGKLLINLNNAVNALSGKPLLAQLEERDYRRVVAASMAEALEMMKAAGVRPAKLGPIKPDLLPNAIAAPDFLFRNTILKMQRIDPKARSSMADDLAAGRQTEIDYLNGEVVRLARSVGRRAPVNSRIVDLIKAAEAGVDRAWSGRELRDVVVEGRAASAAT